MRSHLTARLGRGNGRRLVAAVATSGLVLAGLLVAAPTASAGLRQPVDVSTTVNYGATTNAYAGTATAVSFTVTNRSTTNAPLAEFTIVVPKGVAPVTADGVTVPQGHGPWKEVVAPCLLVRNCSALVLVYATLPLSSSVIRPGESVTANISFTAPSSPTTLVFPLIGIGGGLFTTSSNPTVTVVPANPGVFNSVIATPNSAATLTTGGATATLGNGASGVLALSSGTCTASIGNPCPSGVELDLAGNFKNGSSPLYSFTNPGSLAWTCTTGCDAKDADVEGSDPDYTWNYYCQAAFYHGNTCQSGSSAFGEREVEEDFQDFPVYVSLKQPNGTYGTFTRAPRCVPLPASYADLSSLTTTGQIVDPAARTAGFCVDVNAITRAPNSFTGALSIPVLFVEDPKMRP